MQKIILDTNVIVSALIGSSHPQRIVYDLVFNKKVVVCCSIEIFAEYVSVLSRPKFIKHPEFLIKAEMVLNKIDDLSVKYIPAYKITKIKDESNSKFLELGLSAETDFIITGNKNDFTFKEYEGIRIVSPEEFINQYFQ